MTNVFGASGVYPTPRGQPSQAFTLQPGQTRLVPSGTWNIALGPYTAFQEYDPIQGQWVTNGGESSVMRYVNSDGFNYRIANLSGCVVGALVTTAGSGYTSAAAPVVTVGAGGATFTALVGGAVGTAPTVTNGGTNYTYTPLVFLDPPPLGAGLQATAYATLSGTTVSTITVDNQGAGYTNVPNVYIIPDPRDTTGSGASATATLTAAGTVTQLLCTNIGTALTTIPTITFSSGSAAATPIMVRSIGAYAVSTAGSGYSGTVEISALGSGLSGTNVLTNPEWTTSLVRTRKASIIGALSATALTATGQTLLDGGIYAGSSPTYQVIGTTPGASPAAAAVTFTWANNNDTVEIYPV